MLSQQSTSLGLQAYSWIAEFLKVESEADPSAFRPIFWMQETDTLSTLKNGFQTFLFGYGWIRWCWSPGVRSFLIKKEVFPPHHHHCYSQRIIRLLGFSWCTWIKAQGAGHCFWFIRWVKCWEGVSLQGSIKISLFIFHMSTRLLFTIYSFSSCSIIRCYKLWIYILCRNHSLMTAFVFVSYL